MPFAAHLGRPSDRNMKTACIKMLPKNLSESKIEVESLSDISVKLSEEQKKNLWKR
jgi:hypothetical protein